MPSVQPSWMQPAATCLKSPRAAIKPQGGRYKQDSSICVFYTSIHQSTTVARWPKYQLQYPPIYYCRQAAEVSATVSSNLLLSPGGRSISYSIHQSTTVARRPKYQLSFVISKIAQYVCSTPVFPNLLSPGGRSISYLLFVSFRPPKV
jgi:hypothetical protein